MVLLSHELAFDNMNGNAHRSGGKGVRSGVLGKSGDIKGTLSSVGRVCSLGSADLKCLNGIIISVDANLLG